MLDALEAVYQTVKDGLLEIRADGTVWRVSSKIAIKGLPRKIGSLSKGYLLVNVRVGGKTQVAQAHRLVYRHHHGPLPEGLQINHINGIKDDNRIDNLELVTPSENALHAINVLGSNWGANRGEQHHNAKLTEACVREIRTRRARGEPLTSIAHDFDISTPTVSAIVHRRKWAHVVGEALPDVLPSG